MTLTLEQAIGQKLMLSFRGLEVPPEFLEIIHKQHVGGVTLFRSPNIDTPAQVRSLTASLQAAAQAAGQPPLLIGVDQEGGQLMAIGQGVTQFGGNLALGAIGSPELTQKVGYAMGRELAAMGVNVNYAPDCDINSNPQNPAIGTRAFGEQASEAARLAAAMTIGLQEAGIAATAKHFPGHGDTSTDSHHGLAVIDHDEAQLHQIELPPFKASIEAGVKLIMMGHLALPALHNGQTTIPATLSPQVVYKLLREELGFRGVTITDAMDMGAIEQGLGLTIDSIAAAAAGLDLLLLNVKAATQLNTYKGLIQAAQRGLLAQAEIFASAGRILALKESLATITQPALNIVACAEHQTLAQEVAQKSITLVRNEANLLPLQLKPEARIAVIMPQTLDLTPADTSSYVTNALAEMIRRRHSNVSEFTIAHYPSEAEIAALRAQASQFDLLIVGTLNAYTQSEQAALVTELQKTDIPLVAVAMRAPYDLQVYPTVSTYLCTYSILEPSMVALAQVLWGDIPAGGCLPTSIPSHYPLGYAWDSR